VRTQQRPALDSGELQLTKGGLDRAGLRRAGERQGSHAAPRSAQHHRRDRRLDTKENRAERGQAGAEPAYCGQSSSIPTGAIATT
jgi:hypothetical protein